EVALHRLLPGVAQELGGIQFVNRYASAAFGNQIHRFISSLSTFLWGGARSASRPTLPHAELEDRQIGGLEKRARCRHHFGWPHARAVGQRQRLGGGLEPRAVALAQRRHQGLEGLRSQRVQLAL